MNNKNVKRIAIGSGIAAVVGYVTGVLTAPKSGKDTRKDINTATDKSRAQAEKELKKLHSELNNLIEESKKQSKKASKSTQAELKVLMNKAADTKEKVREIISAIHAGEAEDQDLNRAVKNANDAIDHLKDYLKK